MKCNFNVKVGLDFMIIIENYCKFLFFSRIITYNQLKCIFTNIYIYGRSLEEKIVAKYFKYYFKFYYVSLLVVSI